MFSKYGVSARTLPVYTDATLPDAAEVSDGFIAWNSTYKVLLRSNGTRWEAMSPFVAAQATRTDQVIGNAAESLLTSVDITAAVKYMGPKGSMLVDSGWTQTSSTNSKAAYLRIAATAGTGGTSIMSYSIPNSTASFTSLRRLRAQNSESAQATANASLSGDGSQAGSILSTAFNFADGGPTQILSFNALATGAGENVTLRWYRIVIEPGY